MEQKDLKIFGLLKIHGVKIGEKTDISEWPEEKELVELTIMLLKNKIIIFKFCLNISFITYKL